VKECKTNNPLISFQQITICDHGIISHHQLTHSLLYTSKINHEMLNIHEWRLIHCKFIFWLLHVLKLNTFVIF